MLDILEKSTSILGNMGIFIITAYGFWIYHFSQNIKILSLGEHHQHFRGNNYTCTIINKTLSPKIITKIEAMFDNKSRVLIKKFKEPLLLEPLHSYNVEGDKYSFNLPVSTIAVKSIYFIVTTSEKELLIKYRGRIRGKPKLEVECNNCRVYDGEVIGKDVKYVLSYWHKDEKKVRKILILDNGWMDKSLFDFNAIPENILGNTEAIKNFFVAKFNNPDFNIMLYKLDY